MGKSISILGAGIAGLSMAIALEKKGIKCQIFEAAPSIRALGAGLVLAANAMQAFDRLGIKDEVIAKGSLVDQFSIFDHKGNIISCVDSKAISAQYGADNFTIHRAQLHELLLSKIDPDLIHTHKRIVGFEKQPEGMLLKFEDGSIHTTDYVIAAEGIHSPTRKTLLPSSKVRYAGYTCWRAVVDQDQLQLNSTSETWGPQGRFGIVPLANNKVYWFACVNAPANDSTFKNFKVKDLQAHFTDFHEPVPHVLALTKDEQLLWNDIIDIEPIKQYAFGNIVLIGDAAHATTPNMGQGACMAIEDAVVLADEMSKTQDWQEAFKQFERRRIGRTSYIVNTSWRLGKLAQIENKTLGRIRNVFLRMLPKSSQNQQFKKLYTVDF